MNQNIQHRVIILETNKDKRDYLRSVVSGWGHTPFLFEKETICLDNISTLKPDLVISGSLPMERVYRFINTLKANSRSIPVMIISNDQAIADFVGINGFSDVSVINPALSPAEMKSAISALMENVLHCDLYQDGPLIVGNSHEMLKLKELIADLNHYNETTLIQGEPGTGKELLAKAIHCNSHKRGNPFVKIFAPGLSKEFFLEKNKRYTQQDPREADYDHHDLIGAAHNGTLFIDEIGALPPDLQSGFLQFFEEDGIPKFTNSSDDMRIIASSSTSLELLVKHKKFRKDLYYRLNVVFIEIPPLRDRVSDIPLLTDFFTDRFCIEFEKSHFELSPKTKDIFCNYPWPGNVGELEDTIRKVVLFDREKTIRSEFTAKNKDRCFLSEFEDVSKLVGRSDLKKHINELNHTSLREICRVFMEQAEKKIMKKALEHTNWNRKKAAQMLKISYKSLLNKIKEYQIA